MSIPLSVPDRVVLTTGSGKGDSELTAFDNALHTAGIHNANIIQVSSLIPPSAELAVEPDRDEIEQQISIGGLHPMVVADVSVAATNHDSGQTLTAAIGAGELDSGYGVNVEAHDIGTDTDAIREECREMLIELAETRNAILENSTCVIAQNQVPKSGATAAVAAAVYL